MGTLNYGSEVMITTSAREVMQAVCEVATLHQWNPALSAIRTNDPTAVTGKRYATRVQGLMPATVIYGAITASTATYEIRALGAVERGSWEVRSAGANGTIVSHRFEHRGLILRLVRNAFAPVATWRLMRLQGLLATK